MTNKLWKLEPIHSREDYRDIWRWPVDTNYSVLALAPDAATARQQASGVVGDENRHYGQYIGKSSSPWLDPDYTTCIEVDLNEAQAWGCKR